jgi:hypothetical protein
MIGCIGTHQGETHEFFYKRVALEMPGFKGIVLDLPESIISKICHLEQQNQQHHFA